MKANYGHLSWNGADGDCRIVALENEGGEEIELAKGLTQAEAGDRIARINAILAEESLAVLVGTGAHKRSAMGYVVETWEGSAEGDGKRGYGRVVLVEGERLRIDDSEPRDGLPVAY